MIIGNTPNAVVAEVRKMGRMRRLPASKAASLTGIWCSKRKVSAYSNMMMALRTMIPMRLTIPNVAVMLKSRPNSHNPRHAPNTHIKLEPMVNITRLILEKW